MELSTSNSRFSKKSNDEIDQAIKGTTPENTVRSKAYVWKQFREFCVERGYQFDAMTPIEIIAAALKDWAYNMKKVDGSDYKEMVIKVLWNSTAKQLEESYYRDYGIKLNIFSDIKFLGARQARDAKRRELQANLEKRKRSASSLTDSEYLKIKNLYNEDSPVGLQKKFFYITAYELCWRGGEGTSCRVHYFEEETDNAGQLTGRLEYNPLFTKTEQGGAKKLSESKFLTSNTFNPDACPVR